MYAKKTPQFKNVELSQINGRQDFSHNFYKLLFACAYHAFLFEEVGESYYATENYATSDITLVNTIFDFAEEHFGVDFDDTEIADGDEQSWASYFEQTTSEEQSQLLVRACLSAWTSVFEKGDSSGRLYAALPEMLDVKDWFEHWTAEQEENPVIWTSKTMQTEKGWSKEELETLELLDVFCGVQNFTDFQHTIIRIR